MQVTSFPGCCTAKVITGFGQEQNAGWGIAPNRTYTDREMAQEVMRLVRGPQVGRHNGIVCATLTSRQTQGSRVLRALGFVSSEHKDKTGHRETRLELLYANPGELMDSITDAKLDELFPLLTRENTQKRLVKDMTGEAFRIYRSMMRRRREDLMWANYTSAQRLEMEIEAFRNNPANYIQTT